MFCPSCNAWIENVNACPHCGAKIEREEIESTPKPSASKPLPPEPLGPIGAYASMLKHTFQFSGRCRRRDFWLAFGTNIVFLLVYFIFVTLPSVFFLGHEPEDGMRHIGFGLLVPIAYLFLMCIPILSMMVRRLHDIGRSGFFVLLYIVPIVLLSYPGFMKFVAGDNETIRFLVDAVLKILRYSTFIFFLLDSQPGKNKYGKNPKETGKE